MTKCTRHQPISLIPFLIHSKITVKEWGCHWFHSCFILPNIFILITPRLTFISSSQPEQGLSDFYWHFVAPQTPKMIYVKYYIRPFKVKINLRKFCRIVWCPQKLLQFPIISQKNEGWNTKLEILQPQSLVTISSQREPLWSPSRKIAKPIMCEWIWTCYAEVASEKSFLPTDIQWVFTEHLARGHRWRFHQMWRCSYKQQIYSVIRAELPGSSPSFTSDPWHVQFQKLTKKYTLESTVWLKQIWA